MSEQKDIDARHRARALAKLRLELAKDIEGAARIAESSGLSDLLRLCYLLRIGRIVLIAPTLRKKLSISDVAQLELREEALKYAIGLIAKHGTWREDAFASMLLDDVSSERIDKLEYFARHINAKFELEGALQIGKVRVLGDRDQDCYIDLESGFLDPQRSFYFHYGLRIERSTSRSKEHALPVPDLARRFLEDYFDVSDLFEAQCGISLEAFCRGLFELDNVLRARFQAVETVLSNNGTRRIYPNEARTFAAISRAMYFTDDELESAFGAEFVSYLRINAFDPSVANATELRFHYLTRRPFLMGRGFAILSPELFLDSVLHNSHFALLEGADSKVPYMNAGASRFLDRVATLAASHGYSEVEREVFLKEGKRDIGDIDLVLFNKVKRHTLLIECKNHSLPLDVYFRSVEGIDAHVARNRSWEQKVERRISHLRTGSASCTIDGLWDYIVVSLMPEPLSHLANVLILSLDEFEMWLSQDPRDKSFVQFFEHIYKPEESNMSVEEMERMQQEGFILGRPSHDFPP
ncbi:MAG: hypothetical protein CFE39_03815 [Comamonadaceae bacterium PBBC2]|nr:MAG: hypothetical protein CFE39_03815 [Comamonadaceae bacterium PBBC2]